MTPDSLFSALRQMRVFPPGNLTGDAKLLCDLRPRERFVGAQFLVRVVKLVVFHAVDVNGVRPALNHGSLDEPVEVVAGSDKFVQAVKRIGRPRQFVYERFISHCQHMMTWTVGVVKC